jgi:hypothetical protein
MSPAEYIFRIEGFSPDTLPMARLADYLGDLARLLGSTDHVHFNRLESGSAKLVAAVDQEARPLVNPRVRSAARGEGPRDARAAWAKLNDLLARDGTAATLQMPGGEVIPFPGSTPPAKPIGPIRQPTTVQGRLVRLEGYGEDVWVGIEEETDLAGRIVVKAAVAPELAAHFHRYVRLSGSGRWRRTSEGQWCLEHLDVSSFEALDDEPVGDVLRRVGGLLTEGAAEHAISVIHDLRRA